MVLSRNLDGQGGPRRGESEMTLFVDLDGPVLETARRHFELHRALATELGAVVPSDRAAYWAQKRAGRSSVALLAAAGASPAQCESFRRRWAEEIERPRWLGLDEVQPGAAAALAELRRHLPLVLVTLRQDRAALEAQLDRLGLTVFFRRVLSASPLAGDGPTLKAALIARHAPGAFGAIVGDTEIDLRTGKILGLPTIAVTCGIRDAAQLLAEQPDRILPDLAALTPAVLEPFFARLAAFSRHAR
jgi:phosphoglycolate phosphatase